jgi:hypothetical protein
METTAQTILNTDGHQDKVFNETGLRMFPTESNELVKGLCMNCSNYPGCTFPMKGKALFCEEHE